ncbi:hypothetical protein PENTCL1PPCAC_1126, partial [Pristionchus entomophagus]
TVSDGLDSISVSQSIISLRSSTPLIYLLLLSSFPLLCVTTPLQSATTPLQSVPYLFTVVLSKLGLTTPPALTTPSLPVPEHFWDVYRKVEEGMLDEDSIRLFYPQELIDLNSGLLLSYNLSIEAQQAQKEKVVEARVKLRVRGGRGGQLRIYRVEDLSRLRVERLLDSVEIQEEEEQLLDLDVTEGVPYSNQRHTVKLLVVFPIGCSLAESPSNSLSSISQSRAASASMVVGYVDRQGDEEMEEENEHPKRRKRSASEEERRRKERKERRRKNRKHRNGGEKGICHRKPMYVDFAELNWQDWIMAPPGYEAYQCSGGCPFPFPAQVNASNHAIVQGLLHNYNDEIPEPCCVPTETAPLSILYMDVNSRVVIKQYPDMIVTACGCR